MPPQSLWFAGAPNQKKRELFNLAERKFRNCTTANLGKRNAGRSGKMVGPPWQQDQKLAGPRGVDGNRRV